MGVCSSNSVTDDVISPPAPSTTTTKTAAAAATSAAAQSTHTKETSDPIPNSAQLENPRSSVWDGKEIWDGEQDWQQNESGNWATEEPSQTSSADRRKSYQHNHNHHQQQQNTSCDDEISADRQADGLGSAHPTDDSDDPNTENTVQARQMTSDSDSTDKMTSPTDTEVNRHSSPGVTLDDKQQHALEQSDTGIYLDSEPEDSGSKTVDIADGKDRVDNTSVKTSSVYEQQSLNEPDEQNRGFERSESEEPLTSGRTSPQFAAIEKHTETVDELQSNSEKAPMHKADTVESNQSGPEDCDRKLLSDSASYQSNMANDDATMADVNSCTNVSDIRADENTENDRNSIRSQDHNDRSNDSGSVSSQDHNDRSNESGSVRSQDHNDRSNDSRSVRSHDHSNSNDSSDHKSAGRFDKKQREEIY